MSRKRNIRVPKQERGLDSRDRILESAYKLVKQNGYELTGIRDIVDAAEVSIGTFYAYFKDKNDIAQEVIKRYSEEFYGSLASDTIGSLPPGADLYTVVLELLNRMRDVAIKNKKLHRELEILSLSDEKLSQILRRTEIARIQREVGKLISHFGEKLHVRQNEIGFLVVQRAMDDIVSYMVLQGFEVPDEEILKETARMVSSYLQSADS